MVFENGVKNTQAAAYNGARTVYKDQTSCQIHIFKLLRSINQSGWVYLAPQAPICASLCKCF